MTHPARCGSAQKHVLGDRQPGNNEQLLGDRGDPHDRASRGERNEGLAVDDDLAGVGSDGPGDDLAEGGLARAVLTDDRVDGTLSRLTDTPSSAWTPRALADLAEPDKHPAAGAAGCIRAIQDGSG